MTGRLRRLDDDKDLNDNDGSHLGDFKGVWNASNVSKGQSIVKKIAKTAANFERVQKRTYVCLSGSNTPKSAYLTCPALVPAV